MHVSGDACLVLDGDDVIQTEMSAKAVKVFATNDFENLQFRLVAVDASRVPAGRVFPTYGFSERDIRLDIARWGYDLTPPQSVNFYRKSFLDTILRAPQAEEYVLPFDGCTAGLAGRTGKVVTLNEPLELYRVNGKNVSESDQITLMRKMREFFMRDYVREQMQEQWAARIGWASYRTNLSRFHPIVCKQRFIAYRLQSDGRPRPQEGWWSVLVADVWGAVRFPDLTERRRLVITLGFLSVALMPIAMLGNMVGSALSSDRRPSEIKLLKTTWKRA